MTSGSGGCKGAGGTWGTEGAGCGFFIDSKEGSEFLWLNSREKRSVSYTEKHKREGVWEMVCSRSACWDQCFLTNIRAVRMRDITAMTPTTPTSIVVVPPSLEPEEPDEPPFPPFPLDDAFAYVTL